MKTNKPLLLVAIILIPAIILALKVEPTSDEQITAVVQLSGSVDDAALKMAVEEEGYEVTGIR